MSTFTKNKMENQHIDSLVSRRTFLKSIALAAAGTAVGMPNVARALTQNPRTASGAFDFPDLKFDAEGSFRILQLTDTHIVSGNTSDRSLNTVREVIEKERPDLIIHTGDIIFGSPVKDCLDRILSLIDSYQIPWAVTLGNHDEEYGWARDVVYDYVRTFQNNINTPRIEGIEGCSNGLITLTGRDGKKKWVLYLFDTQNHYNGGWGSVEKNQINWYARESARLREENGGEVIPAMSFSHIPFCEYLTALNSRSFILKGNQADGIACANSNLGIYSKFKEMGDVRTIVCGHNHDNDYVCKWDGRYFIFGRFSGCDSVYNDLKPNGCRMFELNDQDDSYHTYIRLYGDHILQDLKIPDDFAG